MIIISISDIFAYFNQCKLQRSSQPTIVPENGRGIGKKVGVLQNNRAHIHIQLDCWNRGSHITCCIPRCRMGAVFGYPYPAGLHVLSDSDLRNRVDGSRQRVASLETITTAEEVGGQVQLKHQQRDQGKKIIMLVFKLRDAQYILSNFHSEHNIVDTKYSEYFNVLLKIQLMSLIK